jgi:MSHA biogenesis protein MshJ
MKKWWKKQAARIDQLQLRERVFIFISVLLASGLLANSWWLSPAQQEQQQLKQRLTSQGDVLLRLRTDLKNNPQPVDANASTRNELAKIEAQFAANNQEIQTLVNHPTSSASLENVLVQFLRRHEGLTLLGTKTIAAVLGNNLDGKSGLPAPVEDPTFALAQLRQSGLELKVAGSYAALQSYVKTLETALPELRWGPMQLTRTKDNIELTLQVFLLEASL